MEVLDLISIPKHLVIKILQKIECYTFIKILRTEKIISELCYENQKAIKIKLPDHTLQLTFDLETKFKTSLHYQIEYRFRKAFTSRGLLGFSAKIYSVINFDEFLIYLRHVVFFNFRSVCLSEKLATPEARNAVVQVLQMMRKFKMRAEELEMYNTPLCNLAIGVLRPERFRSDFQVGHLMADCITTETLSKVEYMDYFSDNAEDAKGIINFVLPNARYLDCCFDFECEWIWPLLLSIIHKISLGTVINRRLSISVLNTDLPDFEKYFENIPHKYFKYPTLEEHFVLAVFIDIVGTKEKLAIVTGSHSLCESVHYSIVRTFREFSKFYCEVFRKEMYDYSDAVKTDVFGLKLRKIDAFKTDNK